MFFFLKSVVVVPSYLVLFPLHGEHTWIIELYHVEMIPFMSTRHVE